MSRDKRILSSICFLSSLVFTQVGAEEPRLPAVTFCVPREWDGQLDAIAEEQLNTMILAVKEVENSKRLSGQSDDDDDDEAAIEQYTCKLTDALDEELSCRAAELDPAFSSGKIRGVLACFRDGSKRLTDSSFLIKGSIGIKIGKILSLLNIEGDYNRKTQQKEFLYTCRNAESGEVRKGSLDDIVEWYRRYLEDHEENTKSKETP